MTSPKILVIDIETSPHVAYVWKLFKENISLDQLIEPTRMISWAAKWHGKAEVFYGTEWDDLNLDTLYNLLTEADAVAHYNGISFDIPHITRELVFAGYPQLPPIRNIDLLYTVKKFCLASNKLDWAGQQFLGERKVEHEGFRLWRKVLAGDERAQVKMLRYNIGDVRLTDKLLTAVKPFIPGFPSKPLYEGDSYGCRCGSTDLQKRGFHYTATRKYQRYQCNKCGAWSKDTHSVGSTSIVGI